MRFDKEWWQEKLFLFLFLVAISFFIAPNERVKAAYCSLGFSSYCEAAKAPPLLP